MNDIIRTQNLCKHYKETIALDNVSLHIPRGAIYGLIGNNGAGKTTLMRILSNLQSPSSGTVVKSENIKIGAIIETPALYPTLSAKGNLKYQLKICGCPSKEVKSKIAELLELVHLKDTRKLVMNYSLGMRQRLALAMALVGNPQFLILDEPLNGLDAAIAFVCIITVSALYTMIVMISHKQLISLGIAVILTLALLTLGGKSVSSLNQSSTWTDPITHEIVENPLRIDSFARTANNIHVLVSPFAQAKFHSYLLSESEFGTKEETSLIFKDFPYHIEFCLFNILEFLLFYKVGIRIFRKQDLK